MRHHVLLAVVVAACSAVAQDTTTIAADDSTEFGTGILYGKDHAFCVRAPSGWVLDNSSGVSQGLQAVFYPRGGSWRESPSVMYANGIHKETERGQSFAEFIAADSAQFLKNHLGVQILDAPSLLTGRGKRALVKKFIYSQHEAVAYLDEPRVVVLIVLTSRSVKEFEKSYSAFEDLVRSYWFMTEDVTFPDKQ